MRSALVSLWATASTSAAAAAAAAGLASIPPSAESVLASTPLDWIPKLENAGTDALFPMDKCSNFILHEATIDQMQAAMASRTLTSLALFFCYLWRDLQVQPYTHSTMQLNPDAPGIAMERDDEREKGTVRSKLHGVPFTVKDNIATKDNLETTAGSWALMGSRVPRDAHVVAKLREAGAVLFGKATLSEWADMRSSNYSEGYSARGGQCRSAYNLTVNPGGSSSGSAVGVSTNSIAFSLGTETDGSVINPAMRNSIVGFKPTVGLTSRAGVIPESEHQDSVGIFARTVHDAVHVLDAIYGVDCRDNYTLAQIGKTPEGGYAQFLTTKDALKGATFGIPWNSFWVHADAEQLRTLVSLVRLIEDAGATLVNAEITDYETIVSPSGWDWDYGTARGFPNESEYTYVKVDFYNNINKYLSELGNTNIRTLKDIVQYNLDNEGSEGGRPWPLGHPAFYSGQDGFLASLETNGTQDEKYWQSLDFCQTKSRNGIDNALDYKGKRLSGLLVPPDVGQTYQVAAQAGYPMVTLPAGIHAESGMGYGLAIMQTAWAEEELVRWASAIEDLTKHTEYARKLPTWRGYLQRNEPVPL
ncbi:Amidase [Metarhizium album ARSEF 1941]|uniref:Amidase n=1 Tax=Metarhizium album (strain ARSEF 1941) TaxID=1081103 RepID=A0A0B2WSE5_METAS|nr:Amidase [Metarhizium album ARSEF 1941]KHN95875.1 Amidase [Metarhizium album ARSEF 1941]